MAVESFPLSWPTGYPRVNYRKRAIYRAIHSAAIKGLLRELKLLGCPDWNVIISTNMPSGRNGMPLSPGRLLPDPGVAVYFRLKGKRHVFACDKWDRLEDNVRAIEMTVGAMRGMDRWGCSDMLARAFTWFAALPSPESVSKAWSEVLGVDPRDSLSVIETMYRAKAKRAHPDLGGSSAEMITLNRAIEEARQVKGDAQ